MSETDEIALWSQYKSEGKIRSLDAPWMNGEPSGSIHNGNPPRREDCSEIEPYISPESQNPTWRNRLDWAWNYAREASEPRAFEWAVQFPVLVQGRVHGTFYGNRWGWEYVTA